MINIIKKINRNRILYICARYGRLENVKWLLKNKFPYCIWGIFSAAAENGNLENMK